MALNECRYYSEVLGTWCTMNVIVPQISYLQHTTGKAEGTPLARKDPKGVDHKWPTLWLLHGLGDDHSGWIRRTRIEEYAQEAGIAVVMPAAGRSFYADMDRGGSYWTFISEELPLAARSLFPLSPRREHNFVAGNSMGGYGAFKLALTHPDRFAAAVSLSGVLDIVFRADPNWKEFVHIFGALDKLKGSPNDLFHLADRLIESESPVPRLYQYCGTEDFLYEHNLRFLDYARGLNLHVQYEEEKNSHNWAYWDRMIAKAIPLLLGDEE